jgi:hypothetical protein
MLLIGARQLRVAEPSLLTYLSFSVTLNPEPHRTGFHISVAGTDWSGSENGRLEAAWAEGVVVELSSVVHLL